MSAARAPRAAAWLPRALLYAGAVLLSLFILAPIYVITLAAFSSQSSVYDYPKELLPRHLSTDTISFFLHFGGMTDALVRSVIVAAITLALALAVGTPAGNALARFAFRGADTLRLTVVATRAFPIVILSIPLAVIFIRWGIDDTVLGVSIAHTALALPFVVLTTSSVFAGVSSELEEAAMTLGCSRASAFLRVALPLALPGLAASAIFVFIISWNEVFASSLLTLRHRTLPAEVLALLDGAPLNFRFAGGFFLMAPSVIVILLIRRYLFTMWGRVVK
jgi:multiple sugar transport system permease protein